MTDIEIPDFASLLAPHISAIPEPSQPAFLARLERTAADRYRGWAERLPEYAAALLECAAREDDIADRIEKILPATSDADQQMIETEIGPARDTYYQAFSRHSVWEQLYIQANAERQGALAWRAIAQKPGYEALQTELEHCSSIEEQSADYLDQLLSSRA